MRSLVLSGWTSGELIISVVGICELSLMLAQSFLGRRQVTGGRCKNSSHKSANHCGNENALIRYHVNPVDKGMIKVINQKSDEIKQFILPWNVVSFSIGDTIRPRKFAAASAKVYSDRGSVSFVLDGTSQTGCVGKLKIRFDKEEAKDLANKILNAISHI